MGLGIKLDRLIASIIASHVAFAAIDAHLRINESNHMLPKLRRE